MAAAAGSEFLSAAAARGEELREVPWSVAGDGLPMNGLRRVNALQPLGANSLLPTWANSVYPEVKYSLLLSVGYTADWWLKRMGC